MKFLNGKRAARGFTLIELVIVIAVIAILAAILVPTILGQIERARMTRAKGDANKLAQAIARMRADTGVTAAACLTDLGQLTMATASSTCTPENESGPLVMNPCTTTQPGYLCWGGPYLTNILPDPWQNWYKAALEPSNGAITILSNGPDNKTGGANSADDFSYIQ